MPPAMNALLTGVSAEAVCVPLRRRRAYPAVVDMVPVFGNPFWCSNASCGSIALVYRSDSGTGGVVQDGLEAVKKIYEGVA